jgi:hypothetical protein
MAIRPALSGIIRLSHRLAGVPGLSSRLRLLAS